MPGLDELRRVIRRIETARPPRPAAEAVERVVDGELLDTGHGSIVVVRREYPLTHRHGGSPLGDVLGEIAAPLQLGHDAEDRDQVAHVARHRRLRDQLAFGHLLRAIDFHFAPVREVALVGDDVRELAAVVRGAYLPHVVLAGGAGDVPLLAGREPVDGHPAAYVCERFTCQRPVISAEELAKSLQI